VSTCILIRLVSETEDDDQFIPSRKSDLASGFDIRTRETFSLGAGEIRKVACGFKIELPFDCEAVIRPRSGLAAEYGVTVLNAPGTIDSDYRGEVCVILINHGKNTKLFDYGERIAQIIVQKRIVDVKMLKSNWLSDTERGAGGFGSTGKF